MSGGGSGVPSISVGGVTAEIPYADPSAPYALRVTDISLCVAMQQMADSISEQSIRTALQNVVAQALDKEAKLLVSDADAGTKPSVPVK